MSGIKDILIIVKENDLNAFKNLEMNHLGINILQSSTKRRISGFFAWRRIHIQTTSGINFGRHFLCKDLFNQLNL